MIKSIRYIELQAYETEDGGSYAGWIVLDVFDKGCEDEAFQYGDDCGYERTDLRIVPRGLS